MTNPKVYVCSSGTEDQRHSLGVLRDSALSFGGANGVFLYVTDKETATTVIDDAMKRLREPEDVLVYCDANTIIKGSMKAPTEKLEGTTFAIYKKRAWTGERILAGENDEMPDFMEYHGKNLGPIIQTAVITATTGSPSLTRCLASVQAQTLGGVTHVVVVDGEEHRDAVERQVEQFRWKKPIEVVVLPRNTGAGGWNGHRIYGAMPFLTDAHYVAFLDEDNWFLPEHLMGLMKHAKTNGYPWTFSLRAVYDARNGQRFVAKDSCESLGNMAHTVLGPTDFLVDTSCMLLETRVAVEAGSAWYQKERGHDRAYTAHLLRKYPRISGVPRHTVCYTAGSTGNSVAPDFFQRGNDITGYDFEKKKTLYVFHFNPEATRAFFEKRQDLTRSHALDEWQPTLLRDLARTWNLVDGYAVEPVIPPGATVYVSMCMPHQMPLETLRRRAGEIFRVGYTVESPNIRHREQWTDAFLRAHFDRVLTYWTPLLRRDPTFAVFCSHNTHHLDFSKGSSEVLVDPSWIVKKNACMVLERRPGLTGKYSIDSEVLECLDPLREHYVRDLSDVTVYGVGWADEDFRARCPNVEIGHALHRSNDPHKTVDIIKNYDFTIIIENTDADGYVSEKIYDAFIACSIPVYYGNNNDAVGIPRDMYIDLKNFATSRDLDAYIRSLTIEDVRAMKRRVIEGRRAVLERVSTRAFADAFNALFASS